MKKMSSQEIKETMFQILLQFAEYCDKKGLRYYLAGGTLLGAIRHKDFIPWDDDIDVYMPRPDYLRLHEFLKREQLKPYYQIKSSIAGNSDFPFAKIVDIRTVTVTKYNDFDNMLWIDIFPLDGVPSNRRERKKFFRSAMRWKYLFSYSVANIGTGATKWKTVIKIPILLAARIIGYRRCAEKLDQLANTYNFEESDYIANVVWGVGGGEAVKKSEYLDYINMEFHGYKFHVPFSWEKYLKNVYGDFMKIPPENKRYAHCIEVFWKEENG